MPCLLQEALRLGSAGQKDRAQAEDESRKIVWSKVEIGSGPGSAEGLESRPRGSVRLRDSTTDIDVFRSTPPPVPVGGSIRYQPTGTSAAAWLSFWMTIPMFPPLMRRQSVGLLSYCLAKVPVRAISECISDSIRESVKMLSAQNNLRRAGDLPCYSPPFRTESY
jgi:hypothetical protein